MSASLEYRKTAAALFHDNIQNPSTENVVYAADYSVPPTAPSWIAYSGSLARTAVKFDTAGVGLGKIVSEVTFTYRTIGSPVPGSVVSVGIRKANDDFVLIAQHPIESTAGQSKTVTIKGHNEYEMLANDKVSIERTPSNDSIEIACSTTESLPSGFTSQQYDGSYAATTNPLAVRIKTKELVAI